VSNKLVNSAHELLFCLLIYFALCPHCTWRRISNLSEVLTSQPVIIRVWWVVDGVFVGTLGGYGLGVRFVSEFIALLSQDKHIIFFWGRARH